MRAKESKGERKVTYCPNQLRPIEHSKQEEEEKKPWTLIISMIVVPNPNPKPQTPNPKPQKQIPTVWTILDAIRWRR